MPLISDGKMVELDSHPKLSETPKFWLLVVSPLDELKNCTSGLAVPLGVDVR